MADSELPASKRCQTEVRHLAEVRRLASPVGKRCLLEPEELLDLSERSRGEERGGDEDDRENEPETETGRLALPVVPLARSPPRAMEVIGALDGVRIERRPLFRGRWRLHPGHERSVGRLRGRGGR
jgi:hypothetical protein